MENLNTIGPGAWSFEKSDIAKGFDAHVREQLPWYDMVTGSVAHLARHYIPECGVVYDIGASTGNIGRALSGLIEERQVTFIPIERSQSMADQYDGPGRDRLIVDNALTTRFEPFDCAIIFLTMQFMLLSKRRQWLESLVRQCRRGGAVIIVDKFEIATGYLATAIWRMTLAGKVATNAPANEILAKELSLGGVQRPLSIDEVGGTEFFRFGNFAGRVIEAR